MFMQGKKQIQYSDPFLNRTLIAKPSSNASSASHMPSVQEPLGHFIILYFYPNADTLRSITRLLNSRAQLAKTSRHIDACKAHTHHQPSSAALEQLAAISTYIKLNSDKPVNVAGPLTSFTASLTAVGPPNLSSNSSTTPFIDENSVLPPHHHLRETARRFRDVK
ncbi:hypothetical protein TRVL_07077 [Trypanosoma vivax]|nr:hypothetical protein TRVL_07077 [Trypanosoma vivax]